MNKDQKLFSESALLWIRTLLCERYGHQFELSEIDQVLFLTLPGENKNIRFDNLQEIFHQSRSDFPCELWNASSEGFFAPIKQEIPAPSATELATPLIEFDLQGAALHYDVLGLSYWLLTRLEEVGRSDLDSHQRFPAESSHGFLNNYLDRPIVDEWLIILGQVIQCVWPQIVLKCHKFSINVSHDVDRPSLYAFQSWATITRMMLGHLLKRKDIDSFLCALKVKLSNRSSLHQSDPFNTFDWLMDLSETHGLKSSFYFICGRTDLVLDADYEPEHPAIRELMRRIHRRGHEIGLHPSYQTFLKPELIRAEADRLKKICLQEEIHQEKWGGRMHYLRWRQPVTLRAWEQAGMDYDSTLGYPNYPGFRCGTCHEFPAFDPEFQKTLKVRIKPLILMESAITGQNIFMSNIVDRMCTIKDRCQLVGGDFNILWHNSSLVTNDERVAYIESIR